MIVQSPIYLSTAADFDAALKAQRDAKIAALQKAATHFGWTFWIAIGFGALSLGLMIAVYFVDGHRSVLPYVGPPIMFWCLALSTGLARRRHAAQQLVRERACAPSSHC